MKIEEIKQRIDCHELADRLGLEQPGGKGNYRSPHHDDKSPSLQIFKDGRGWKDYSTDEGGSCIDLVMYVREIDDVGEALKLLHEMYGFPMDKPDQPQRERSVVDFVADKVVADAEKAKGYLIDERKIPEAIVNRAIKRRAIGFSDYTKPNTSPGENGHGGDAVAFVTRTMNPGHPIAVDYRYFDAENNGGRKQHCLGEKNGYPFFTDLRELQRAHTVYVCEAPINALSIEAAELKGSAALAIRGARAVVDLIDWRFLIGKRVIAVFDWDEPDKFGHCAGQETAWMLHERLTALNISCQFIQQDYWTDAGYNDINDLIQSEGPEGVRIALGRIEDHLIPGLPGNSDERLGRARVHLPLHDFAQYWRFKVRPDFTTFVKKKDEDEETGESRSQFQDVCGFRVAALSRVDIASATSVMTGEKDSQPHTSFAASVQTPRHGANLVRRVFDDEKLHNVDQWRKFGPIYSPQAFQRMVNIMERTTEIGARRVVNYVGLAWRDGELIVNQGPDTYFTDPNQQCPYHNLTFPSGDRYAAQKVIGAYQKTMLHNAGLQLLVWALGAHMKAFLGFWPHMTIQANKGAGKSTLIKRLERSIAFTMLSGQSIETPFRMLTSISHTSHPVGWEELSARDQRVIDKAVNLLQENYQYTITRRGTDMTEFLLSAPVLLAGEDVPVKTLLGKLVRIDIVNRKGDIMPDDLPQFPVLQWLQYLSRVQKSQVIEQFEKMKAYCMQSCRASGSDDGAVRMAGNYAAILTAWKFIADFAGVAVEQGNFGRDLIMNMNEHVSETSADREPWVWIMETVLSEIDAGEYRYPYMIGPVKDPDDPLKERECLILRPSHVMDHISTNTRLREKWNALPVKTARVFKRQLLDAGVVVTDNTERSINRRRWPHLTALDIEDLAEYGLHVTVDDQAEQASW